MLERTTTTIQGKDSQGKDNRVDRMVSKGIIMGMEAIKIQIRISMIKILWVYQLLMNRVSILNIVLLHQSLLEASIVKSLKTFEEQFLAT